MPRLVINIDLVTGLMHGAGYKNQTALAEAMGLNHSQALNRYLKNRSRPTSAIIETLCDVLDCQPGQFLEYK